MIYVNACNKILWHRFFPKRLLNRLCLKPRNPDSLSKAFRTDICVSFILVGVVLYDLSIKQNEFGFFDQIDTAIRDDTV